jgi:hypothetical protein
LRIVRSIREDAILIGARRLSSAADLLQPLLKLTELPLDAKSFRPFLTELAATNGMLRYIFPDPPACDLPQAQSLEDVQALLKDLASLNALLADDDADACRVFSDLRPRLATVNSSATDQAAKALAVFDFSTALSLLAPMENGLKAVLEEERKTGDPDQAKTG